MYVGQLTVYHMLSGVRRSQNTYSAEKLHHLEDQNHGRQSGWKKKLRQGFYILQYLIYDKTLIFKIKTMDLAMQN